MPKTAKHETANGGRVALTGPVRQNFSVRCGSIIVAESGRVIATFYGDDANDLASMFVDAYKSMPPNACFGVNLKLMLE